MRRTAGQRLLRAAWIAGPLSVILGLALACWSVAPAPAATTLSAMVSASPFGGTPAIGALFTISGGRLGSHFCTASVVHSPEGDLILTAAHCLAGYSETSPGIAFVPGYVDGAAPEGVWLVTRIFVDQAWAATSDPDDDFAFLTVEQPGSNTPIEYVTGAEHLGIDQTAATVTRVIGYPDTQAQPIICQNRTSMFSATQAQFDCGGFTEGTSGSPFLIDPGGPSGSVIVTGVIGGYEQGGDSPDVSYAATFGPNAQALYDVAISQG